MQPGQGVIEEQAHDCNTNWMTAVEILEDGMYLGAENCYTDDDRGGGLQVVGRYHLGELVNRFRHGSLIIQLPDGEGNQVPTVVFGTVNGVIGLIASLPNEQFLFLQKLQQLLVKVIKGVGGCGHERWRSFHNHQKTMNAHNFLDGDLIESFLDLGRQNMENVANSLDVSVENLCTQIEELTRLH
jgi:DNA damage-binding protein 1